MLILSSFEQFVIHERVVKTRCGKLARVKFEIIEINGEIRGRIISVSLVHELGGAETASRFCLSGDSNRNFVNKTPLILSGVISPFRAFEFFVSQMTRAPAL